MTGGWHVWTYNLEVMDFKKNQVWTGIGPLNHASTHTFFDTSVMTPLMPTTTGVQRKERHGHVHRHVLRDMAVFIKMTMKTQAPLSET